MLAGLVTRLAVVPLITIMLVALGTTKVPILVRAALVDVVTVGLAVAGAVLLIRFRVSSVWLVLAGGVVGVLLHR